MAKRKNTYPKTFRPSKVSKIGILILFLILGFVFIASLLTYLTYLPSNLDLLNGIGSLVIVFWHYLNFSVIWYLSEYIMNFTIVVTSDGLWFHGYGKRFYTWDTMQSFTKDYIWSPYHHRWGIHVTNAALIHRNQISKWLVGNWFFDKMIPLEGIVKVPKKWLLFRDVEAFKQTEFGQELFYFAPHLFDEAGQEKRKNRLYDADEIDDYVIVSSEDYQELGR